jgi:HAD superfamily hydrolase (TIGR01509 family)
MSERALILDCDGVLADTELDGHLVAFNAAFEELALPFRWSAKEYGPLLRVGGGKERLRAYLAEHPEIDMDAEEQDATIAELHRRKSELYVDLVRNGALPARPGIARLVAEALDSGWEVACASTSAASSVEAVLTSVVGDAQRARMAGVFAGDIVPAKKPAPDIYLLAANRLGLRPDEVVVIEDSQSGAAAAAAAGMPHIVTLSHFTVDDDFPDAAVVVDSLGDPGKPAILRCGMDVRNDSGLIDLASLEAVIEAARAKR